MPKAWRSCLLNINGRPQKFLYTDEAIKKLFLPLLGRLAALQKAKARRIVVYLAAPADTGKTTLALFLARLSLTTSGLVPVQRLGLEGFSRPPAELAGELDDEGRPLSPYGPQAYDLAALQEKIAALRAGDELRWPVFDRSRRTIVRDITPVTKPIVLIEGCWLLYQSHGWDALKPYADYTLAIAAPPESLAARIEQRLISRGLTPKEASERYEADYRPAIMQVLTGSAPANETWIYGADGDYLPQPDRLRNYHAKQKQTQQNFDSVKRSHEEQILHAYEEQMASSGQNFALGYQQGLEVARRNIFRKLAGAGGMGKEKMLATFHLTEEELDELLK